MPDSRSSGKCRAPTLYVIIAFKLVKGLALVAIAVVIYRLSERNLPEELHKLLRLFHMDPEREFFVRLTTRLDAVNPRNVVWVAVGTATYGLFLLLEGVGLFYRAWWAGWLVIGSSLFFVPIEIYDLLHRFTWLVTGIATLNLAIVGYLYQNRGRLFQAQR